MAAALAAAGVVVAAHCGLAEVAEIASAVADLEPVAVVGRAVLVGIAVAVADAATEADMFALH